MARIARLLTGAVASAAVLTALTGVASAQTGSLGSVGTDSLGNIGTGSLRSLGTGSDGPSEVNLDEAFPGMRINFDGQEGYLGSDLGDGRKGTSGVCTLGVVGTDSAGRNVGITAGHCNPGTALWDLNPKHPGATRGVENLENNHPVFNTRTANGAEPIGWIRWVDDNTCDTDPIDVFPNGAKCVLKDPVTGAETPAVDHTDPDSTTDYMVIEFAPRMRLTSQVKDKNGHEVMSTTGDTKFKIDSIFRDASGAVAVPTNPQYVENFGSSSDRRTIEERFTGWADDLLFQASAPSSGVVGAAMDGGLFRSGAAFVPGDSGGPVALRGTGQWVGIITATDGTVLMPWVNTSAKNILADLNPRGVVGSGFTPSTS
ncbi:hypothetical protein DEU38_101288 [Rhodococcus sp. AG1013]|uniref:hypothetical protein n=1 Tax=Rhodococcus sp. AG1013 TaxID=2183996 RepID=UPI000E0AA4D1|nr:hypothetical protein [Rhodococcus sp. AG1013]RDI35808.1 hypothetical protein DEU38_101288 [Rhodococcus sp. AG1013]